MERNRALGAECRDLPARVHACIGARSAGHPDLVREQLRERLFEVLLHGRSVQLALPAMQRRAVIFDNEADVPHGTEYHTPARRQEPVPLGDKKPPTLVTSAADSRPRGKLREPKVFLDLVHVRCQK